MNNKITLLLISLLMSIVCFSSCSDDDDSDSISIVGTWRWVDDSGNTQETYTFTSKQTYREEWSDGDWSGSESGSYFFDQKTKILFLYPENDTDEPYYYTVSRLDSKVLILVYDDYCDGLHDHSEDQYERIK